MVGLSRTRDCGQVPLIHPPPQGLARHDKVVGERRITAQRQLETAFPGERAPWQWPELQPIFVIMGMTSVAGNSSPGAPSSWLPSR